MNKLIVDKEILLEDYVGTIDIVSDEVILNIKGNCKIDEITLNNHRRLIINVLENSNLEYNRFSLNPCDDGYLEINHEDKAYSLFNEGILCNKDYKMDLNVYEKYSHINSKVLIRILTIDNASVFVNASGYVFKDTLENEITEDVRAFNSESSKISILPNLIVDSNDVIANHNVTISNVNEDDLFYLNSKGINDEEAIKLLRNGFMLSIFTDDKFKDMIKKYL